MSAHPTQRKPAPGNWLVYGLAALSVLLSGSSLAIVLLKAMPLHSESIPVADAATVAKQPLTLTVASARNYDAATFAIETGVPYSGLLLVVQVDYASNAPIGLARSDFTLGAKDAEYPASLIYNGKLNISTDPDQSAGTVLLVFRAQCGSVLIELRFRRFGSKQYFPIPLGAPLCRQA